MYAAHDEAQDIAHEPRGDVGVNIHSECRLESLTRAGNDLRKETEHDRSEVKGREEDATSPTRVHILGDSTEGQNMAMRIIVGAAPLNVCDDGGQAPQCSELAVVPSSAIEDVGEIAVDAAFMPSEEGKVGV